MIRMSLILILKLLKIINYYGSMIDKLYKNVKALVIYYQSHNQILSGLALVKKINLIL